MKKNSTYLIILLIAFISCSKDTLPSTPVAEGETQVTLNLEVFDMLTRSEITEDEAIESLSILVFEKNSDDGQDYKLFYKTTATAGQNDNYTVILRAATDSVKLFFIANHTDLSTAQTGHTPEEITKILIAPFTNNGFSHLPMSGVVDLEELPSGEAIEIGTIQLIRSIAGVKVENTANKFELKSIQAYRANSQIQLIPDQLSDDEVSTASVPQISEQTITSQRVEPDKTLYIPESVFVTKEDRQATATCLIIGGIYKENDQDTNNTITYYRVDFGKEEDNNIGQLLRNHLYKIKITHVAGPGTTHPDEAVTDISTIIYDWGESDHKIEL